MFFFFYFYFKKKERGKQVYGTFCHKNERYLKNNKRRRIERFKISEKHEKFVRNLKRQIKKNNTKDSRKIVWRRKFTNGQFTVEIFKKINWEQEEEKEADC